MDSILNSIKKLHGISEEDTSFDTDMLIHINNVFMILNQLGVGPSDGFYIEDDVATWDDYVPNKFITRSIQSFMYIKVRLVFDPPASPTIVDALKSSAKEDEWRIVLWAEQHSQV
jgi:hypothetical protein